MPVDQIIAMLRAEREKIDRALEALEAGVKRRGRPAGSGRKSITADYNDPTMADSMNPKSSLTTAKPKRTKRKFSAAQKKAASERMKARWAAKKKAAK